MNRKTEFLQIRVSPREKAALKKAAIAAGLDVSQYVLSRALPEARARLEDLVSRLEHGADTRFLLAELNDLLGSLSAAELGETVAVRPTARLSRYMENYVAAMVEVAAHVTGTESPGWTSSITPLDEPVFVSPLESLRLHLLRASPVPFKRRNIFIDSSIGARV